MPIRLLLFAALLAFMTACAPKKPSVPTWVKQPPAATQTELFGVSVAHTPEEAVVSAAGGIAAAVLDAAKPLLKSEVPNKGIRRKTEKQMKLALQSLDYNATKVKEQVAMGKETAVLVSIPRAGFAVQLESRLRKRSNEIAFALSKYAHAPQFEHLGVLGALHEDQADFIADILLVQTLKPAADLTAYRKQLQKVESDYNAFRFGVGVTVISDAGGIFYVETMQKALRSEGVNPSAASLGTILISSDSQRDLTGATYRVKTRLHIRCTVDGKQVAQSEHYLEGTSTQSYADASRNTANSLSKIIAKEGLFHTLGF
jgi:hypothetical protein